MFATIYHYFHLVTGFFAASVVDWHSHQIGQSLIVNRAGQFVSYPSTTCAQDMFGVLNNVYGGGVIHGGTVWGVRCPDIVYMIIGASIFIAGGILITPSIFYFQKRTHTGTRNRWLLWGAGILWAAWIIFLIGYGDFARRNQGVVRPPATRRLWRSSVYPEMSIFIPVGFVFAALATVSYIHPERTLILFLTNVFQYLAVVNTGAYLDNAARIIDTGFRTEYSPSDNSASQAVYYPPVQDPLYPSNIVYVAYFGFPQCSQFTQECQRIRLILAGACLTMIAILFFYEIGLAVSVMRIPNTVPTKGQTIYGPDGQFQAVFPVQPEYTA